MRRASYRYAIQWIAMNDSAGESTALEPTVVESLITSLLVADLFGVTSERVGRDVVRERKREYAESRKAQADRAHDAAWQSEDRLRLQEAGLTSWDESEPAGDA